LLPGAFWVIDLYSLKEKQRMQEYIIDAGEIEELQTISNKGELDKLFDKAKRTIVNGEPVWLVRKQRNGEQEKYDELTTLEELAAYKNQVYKYL
jgi:hypothetical protein